MSLRKRLLAGVVAGTVLFGITSPSYAYYSKTDYAEWVEIQPNQSAFLIPMQGANQSTQAQFGSIDYYSANKVATKRVQIPHAKLPNTGSIGDYNVPTAKLIVVERTPYSREWTNDTSTGTSNKKEGISVESSESINIWLDVMISAHVTEENAAKFLYNFGTKSGNIPQYDATAQYQSDAFYSATYASISYGYSLAEVMDRVARGEVQSEFAKAFAAGNLEYDIAHKQEIVNQVQKTVTQWLADRGITLDYLGLGSSLSFDKAIQDSINNVFVAKQDSDAIAVYKNSMEQRRQIAEIKVIEAAGTAIAGGHWPTLPALPNWLVVPSNVVDWATSWLPFGHSETTTPPPAKVK